MNSLLLHDRAFCMINVWIKHQYIFLLVKIPGRGLRWFNKLWGNWIKGVFQKFEDLGATWAEVRTKIFQGVGGLYQRLSYVVCMLELKKELIIRNYYFHSLVLHHYFWTALNVILVGYTKGVGNPLFSGWMYLVNYKVLLVHLTAI